MTSAVENNNEHYLSLRSFQTLGPEDLLLQFDDGERLPVHRSTVSMFSNVLRSVLETTGRTEQEMHILPIIGDDVNDWRGLILLVYGALEGMSKEALWEHVSKVERKSKKGSPIYTSSTCLSRDWDCLRIEQLANKYDMPMHTNMALDRVEQQLRYFIDYHWDYQKFPEHDPAEAVTQEVWLIAERCDRWRRSGIQDACVEIITRPLLSDLRHSQNKMSVPGMIVLPDGRSALGNEFVRKLCKAVNLALLNKANITAEDIAIDDEAFWKYL